MNLNEIICGLVGHKPFRPKNKKKWRRDCKRCGKKLVAHNPTPAPYKVEPDPIALAKQIPDGEGVKQEER